MALMHRSDAAAATWRVGGDERAATTRIVRGETSWRRRYEVKSGDIILAEEKHAGIYDELVKDYSPEYRPRRPRLVREPLDAAAATRIARGDASRRRRGCRVDIPSRRVAAAPRVPRGSFEGTKARVLKRRST